MCVIMVVSCGCWLSRCCRCCGLVNLFFIGFDLMWMMIGVLVFLIVLNVLFSSGLLRWNFFIWVCSLNILMLVWIRLCM